MNDDKNLEALRAAILAECDARWSRGDDQLDTSDVAAWLVRHKRAAVIDGLTDLVSQVIEQWNHDGDVREMLEAKPELQPLEGLMRPVSETLGVPLWHLLELGEERLVRCCAAAHFIHQLRIEVARDAIREEEEFGRPNMTAGQALPKLNRRTVETIQ